MNAWRGSLERESVPEFVLDERRVGIRLRTAVPRGLRSESRTASDFARPVSVRSAKQGKCDHRREPFEAFEFV